MKLAAIVLAIRLSAPWMSAETATGYAKVLRAIERLNGTPPALLVAIVENESRWHPGVWNRASGAAGLAGVMPSATPLCEGQPDPCPALLDPGVNLTVASGVLRANWRYCGRRWDRALAGYQTGRCRPIGLTRRVLARWRTLERGARGRR